VTHDLPLGIAFSTSGAAIRPVPTYARVPATVLADVERDLSGDSDEDTGPMTAAFARFEETQQTLAARVHESLESSLHETALALGCFLTVAVWLAFERTFPSRLREVTDDTWSATIAALALEEDLWRSAAGDSFNLTTVLAREQPEVARFVSQHVTAAVETCVERAPDDGAKELEPPVPRDLEAVVAVVVATTLALSHAVVATRDDQSLELSA
jgi:hypothetical protein